MIQSWRKNEEDIDFLPLFLYVARTSFKENGFEKE
jgi:hypothetical protein